MAAENKSLTIQPPPTESFTLSYPSEHIVLMTINRPRAMNSLTYGASWEADALFSWYDAEPSLRVAIVTGAGKAFCAGQDLIETGMLFEMEEAAKRGEDVDLPDPRTMVHPPSGFMGVSRRAGKKPVIAAVNGPAMGGGFEACLGCDMVLASPTATFALPEATRGIFAAAGGLSRLVRLVGLPLASEIALAGRVLTAPEAAAYHIINRVSASPESLLQEALAMAEKVVESSPDAAIVTRAGLRLALEEASVERATQITGQTYRQKLREGENVLIGMQAFAKRQKPKWLDSKL